MFETVICTCGQKLIGKKIIGTPRDRTVKFKQSGVKMTVAGVEV